LIVSLHVATGAAAGTLVRSPRAAVAVGAVLHALGDRMPHMDIRSRRFEIGSGLAMVGALAVRQGPLAPATVGALAASAPDLEHILPLPRPGGRKLFPSHRVRGWHRSGGLSAGHQLLVAGILFGVALSARNPFWNDASSPGRAGRRRARTQGRCVAGGYGPD
jgi:hypothetical protein